jgi:hypothetical protein
MAAQHTDRRGAVLVHPVIAGAGLCPPPSHDVSERRLTEPFSVEKLRCVADFRTLCEVHP